MNEEPTTIAPAPIADGELEAPRPRAIHVTAFTLKLAAIICMTANHAVWILGDHMSRGVMYALFGLGGATFPIMAFMLVEGYRHTSNLKRYAGRLALWAVISQVPFYLFLSDAANYYVGDVLFTLLIGLVIIAVRDRSKGPAFWLVLIIGVYISNFCDWGLIGPIIILAYYMSGAGPDKRWATLLVLLIPVGYCLIETAVAVYPYIALGYPASILVPWALPNVLYGIVGGSIAAVLLYNYDGTLGRPLAHGSSANKFNVHTLVKWGFYAYYPLHITVLGLIAMALS